MKNEQNRNQIRVSIVYQFAKYNDFSSFAYQCNLELSTFFHVDFHFRTKLNINQILLTSFSDARTTIVRCFCFCFNSENAFTSIGNTEWGKNWSSLVMSTHKTGFNIIDGKHFHNLSTN